MSLTIRYVSDGIFEHFFAFVVVGESTGKNLFAVLLAQLSRLGLDYQHIRDQGCDNGANMKGHKTGVHLCMSQLQFVAW